MPARHVTTSMNARAGDQLAHARLCTTVPHDEQSCRRQEVQKDNDVLPIIVRQSLLHDLR
ncbi:hypothetical protein HanRHA438_Chr03g0112981 [Helianthus annuus]|nr:hypothetical protein HanRHA438_Chr03g0112981 [Helianthus annuus]